MGFNKVKLHGFISDLLTHVHMAMQKKKTPQASLSHCCHVCTAIRLYSVSSGMKMTAAVLTVSAHWNVSILY